MGGGKKVAIQSLHGRIRLHTELGDQRPRRGTVVCQRRRAIAGALVQPHDLAVKSLLEGIDGQRASGVRQGTRPVVVGGVGFGCAFERVEHALLPCGALELEPFVPVGAAAQVEALEKWTTPQVDGTVEIVARGAGSREVGKCAQIGPHAGIRVRAPGERVAEWHDGSVGQRAAEPRQGGAETVAALRLVAFLPQQGDQPSARDGLVRARRQVEHERRALVRSGLNLHGWRACFDLGGPEEAQPQYVPVCSQIVLYPPPGSA